jgi:hypothetical protein
MFPLISSITLKVSALRLADTQQQTHLSSSQLPHQQPTNQYTKSSFGESFTYSVKQGGGATVLMEGCDIVTRETCNPYSLKVNVLGKAAVLHFALTHFCSWGRAKLSLWII